MSRRTDSAPLYGMLVLFLAGLALAGYSGYVVYPRFDLPAAAGIGLLILSVGAGIASFFSPCSFPLLLTLLARHTGSEREQNQRLGNRPFPFAAALAVGASGFFLLQRVAMTLALVAEKRKFTRELCSKGAVDAALSSTVQ